VVFDGPDAKSVLLVHGVVSHDAFRRVALQSVLIQLLLAGERFGAAVALKDAIGWDVVSVMLQVSLDLDGLNEELSAAANLADELGFCLRRDWLVVEHGVESSAMSSNGFGIKIISLGAFGHRAMVDCHHGVGLQLNIVKDEIILAFSAGHVNLDDVNIQIWL